MPKGMEPNRTGKSHTDASHVHNSLNDHVDHDKFPTMNMRHVKLGGIIVVLGLLLGAAILGYNVMTNEIHRGDFAPSNSSAPIKP